MVGDIEEVVSGIAVLRSTRCDQEPGVSVGRRTREGAGDESRKTERGRHHRYSGNVGGASAIPGLLEISESRRDNAAYDGTITAADGHGHRREAAVNALQFVEALIPDKFIVAVQWALPSVQAVASAAPLWDNDAGSSGGVHSTRFWCCVTSVPERSAP
jgi:hypothetical protein